MMIWKLTEPGPKPSDTGSTLRRWKILEAQRSLQQNVIAQMPGLCSGLAECQEDLVISKEQLTEWLTQVEHGKDSSEIRIIRQLLKRGFAQGICTLNWRVSLPDHLVLTVWKFTDPGSMPAEGGHILRAWHRMKDERRVQDMVHARLADLNGGLTALQPDISIATGDLSLWLDRVESDLTGGGMQSMRRFLRRGLMAGSRELGWQVPIPPRLIELKDLPPVVDKQTIHLGNKVHPLVEALLKSLSDSSLFAKTPPKKLRAGQLLLATIVFGGLLHSRLLFALCRSFPRDVWRDRNLIWIDLHDKERDGSCRLIRRWLAPPICELLLIAWLKDDLNQLLGKDDEPTYRGVWALIAGFLRKFTPDSDISSLDMLFECVRAYMMPCLDSVLYRYASLSVDVTSLPAPVWWRLIRGQALVDYLPPIAPISEERPGFVPREPPSFPVNTMDSKKALTLLGKILSSRLKPEKIYPDGTILHADENNALSSTNLTHLTRFIDDFQAQLAPIVYCLASWVEHMLTFGTRRKHSKVAKTIETYFLTIAWPIESAFGNVNPINLDGDTILAAYSSIIDRTPPRSVQYRADRIREFHKFIEEQFHAEPVAWDAMELPDSSTAVPRANLLTPPEFNAALEFLLKLPDERQRTLCRAFLVIGFRFGLRPNELKLLAMCDINLEFGLWVAVRLSDYQSLKTDNANRRMAGSGRLSSAEKAIVQEALDLRKKELGWYDRLALIFCDRDLPYEPLSDDYLANRVVQAMRAASGDPSMILYDLRHGYASFQYVSSRIESDDEDRTSSLAAWYPALSLWRKYHVFSTGESRRSLWMIAASLGHGDGATALRSYIHTTDLALDWALRGIAYEVTPDAVVNLTRLPKSTTYRKIKESGGSATQFLNRHAVPLVLGTDGALLDRPCPFQFRNSKECEFEQYAVVAKELKIAFDPNIMLEALRELDKGTKVSRISKSLRVPIPVILAWREASIDLQSVITSRGRNRHDEKYLSRHSLDGVEQAILESMREMFAAKSKKMERCLNIHAKRKRSGLSYIDLDDPMECREYINGLISLGIKKSLLVIMPGKKRFIDGDRLQSEHPEIDVWSPEQIADASTGEPAAGHLRLFVRIDGEKSRSRRSGLKARQNFSVAHHWLLHWGIVFMWAMRKLK